MRVTAAEHVLPCPFRSRRLSPIVKALILILIGVQGTLCWMAKERSLKGDVDLRAFYGAGSIVREGRASQLYDLPYTAQVQQKLFGSEGRTLPFLYPAVAALPFVLFAHVPYPVVFIGFLMLNLGLLYGSACLINHSKTNATGSTNLLFGCFLCLLPTSIALMQGQISFLLLFVFVGSHVLAERGSMFRAGLLLSVGLVKFQFVLPIILLLIVWRYWRLLYGFLLGGTGMAATSLLITGREGMRDYLACLHAVGISMSLNPTLAKMRFGMEAFAEPNLHGLITSLMGSGLSSTVLLVASSALIIAWTGCFRGTIATAIPAAMLVSYHMQPYDLIFLLLPAVTVLQEGRAKAFLAARSRSTILVVSLLTLTPPLASFVLMNAKTASFIFSVGGVLFACTPTWKVEMLNHYDIDSRHFAATV